MDKFLSKNYKKIIILVIALWIVLALIRFFYSAKVFLTNDIFLLKLSGEEKRKLYYGDIYPLYLKLNSISQTKDCFYLHTAENTSYFLLRYLLYPKKIYWVNGPSEKIRPGENKCKIIVFYNQKVRTDSPNFNIYPEGLTDVSESSVEKSTIFIIK